MRTFISIFFLSIFLGQSPGFGQSDTLAKPGKAYIEVGGVLTTGTAVPFWLRANQYGTVPLTGSLATYRMGLLADYKPSNKLRFDWGYGLELVGNIGQGSQQLLLPQAYLKGRWHQLELYAGRRKAIVGLVDTLLTSGSYSLSGNAMPLPTIQLGTHGFVAVPFTKHILSIYATYGHAWFETVNRKVEHTLLHQATLYARIGKPSWPVRFIGGINHQVIWGGYSPYLGNSLSNNGHLPSSFKAYLYAVTALPYSNASIDGNVTSFDETNRIGNHLGSLDIGAEFSLGNCTFLLYRQNPYDTGAIWYLTTIADGLNGLSIRRQKRGSSLFSIDRGLIEFLYTANQGGGQFIIDDPAQRGKVNYFNNSQYVDGWTTRAHTIGTPFLTPEGDVRPHLPYGPIINNRVTLWHIGLSGRFGSTVNWLLKFSESRNKGTYDTPFATPLDQFSALLQITAPLQLPLLGELLLTSRVATDQGAFLPRSTGLYISLQKGLQSTGLSLSSAHPKDTIKKYR
ncbi:MULTISPECIES: capsule assembly Wzi family protein [unclassified Spirosoma]|uniref:capsule assembly Wzi family protein n=1 Tax=unclassified Spirosoma TaxID=2621999 RepID=UPI000AA84C7F|nr:MULTISPECIES: capsule assembly Wzi family protein [unclassified Spirosoma]MBN8822941.1 hypothetical protein [Spirosoma sp.]